MRALGLGSFAMVMATGIVSVDMHGRAVPWVSVALLAVAAAAYAVLVVRTCARLAGEAGALRAELSDPGRAFGSFAFVAATGVLGVRVALAGDEPVAFAALAVAVVALLALGLLVPWRVARGSGPGRSLADGTWFLCAVACQSVAVLAATTEPGIGTGGGARALTPLAVAGWVAGAVLYVFVLLRIVGRFRRRGMRPAELHPPYWVTMGATAITVLAGARIMGMRETPSFVPVRDVVGVASIAFWAFGTALVPVLLAGMWWRHVRHRVRLRYEPAWWSAVFPLGMYGAASLGLGAAAHLPVTSAIGAAEVWLALAVWLILFTALLLHLSRLALRRAGR
ncbi:MAG TPA: tellurite resistance/C4-dicarboxylate transporter family protein [Streptosporangiales bacterium]